MAGVCRASKRNGEPCTSPATGSDGYCWAHDPKNAEKRRRMASRAGKSRPGKELADLKADIRAVITDVLSGEVEKGRAAVALQGFNALIRVVEVGRRDDLEDLAREVEELKRGYGGAA